VGRPALTIPMGTPTQHRVHPECGAWLKGVSRKAGRWPECQLIVDILSRLAFTLDTVIVSFRHAGLRELFETGKSRKVQPDLHKRCRRAMDALHAATALSDLNMPGWSVHLALIRSGGRFSYAA
jgi:proteic killer suppression protein